MTPARVEAVLDAIKAAADAPEPPASAPGPIPPDYPLNPPQKAIGLPLPPDDIASAHAAAFLIGVCAMWIADIRFEIIVRWFKPPPEK